MSDEPFIPFTNLLPYLQVDLPGCPNELKMQQAVEVWRAFCEDTECWRFDIDRIMLREDEPDYDLDDPPCGSEIVSIVEAWQDGVLLDPSAYELVERNMIRLASIPGSDTTLDATATTRENDKRGLNVKVALRPISSATDIDARVYNDYYSAIVDGIVWQLAAQPKKPWTSPEIANYRLQQYENKKVKARADLLRGGPGASKPLYLRVKKAHRFV